MRKNGAIGPQRVASGKAEGEIEERESSNKF
jgi:hypothetical protein